MKKPIPQFATGEEAERFVAEADLTDYELSEFRTVLFKFQPKSPRVNMWRLNGRAPK
jgi:predicted DNA binding CopG/RHH family protein